MQRQEKVAELKKAGKGTPVTPESFAAWQEGKRKKRAEAARKTIEAELKKKKGGKGLSVLSGRDLYEYKKELFADRDDDDGDVGDDDDNSREEENSKPLATVLEQQNKEGGLEVDKVAAELQTELFLEGDDDDLEDLDDD